MPASPSPAAPAAENKAETEGAPAADNKRDTEGDRPVAAASASPQPLADGNKADAQSTAQVCSPAVAEPMDEVAKLAEPSFKQVIAG